MKKLFQLLTAFAISLLAAQPALAALSCETAVRCTMGASETGASCPMAPALGECSTDCCAQSLLPADQSWAATAKSRALDADHAIVVDVVARHAESATASLPFDPVDVSSPPRFILHRVFRI
jgi:hypothetical protein